MMTQKNLISFTSLFNVNEAGPLFGLRLFHLFKFGQNVSLHLVFPTG